MMADMDLETDKEEGSVEKAELIKEAREKYLRVLNATIQKLKIPFANSGTDLSVLERFRVLWTGELETSLGTGDVDKVALPVPPPPDVDIPLGDCQGDLPVPLDVDIPLGDGQGDLPVPLDVDIPQADGNNDGSSTDMSDSDDDDLLTVTSSKYFAYTKSSVVGGNEARNDDAGRNDELGIDVEVDGFGNQLGLEKAIGTDDDMTDEENHDWKTENTIHCVIKKLTRSNGVWRMELLDGVIHIQGIDHFFKKASFEAKW